MTAKDASMGVEYNALPSALADAVVTATADWHAKNKVARLWDRDASLWTGRDENLWLGWLDVMRQQRASLVGLRNFARDVNGDGFTDVVLLGMGGSSLCADVLRTTFGHLDDAPELHILDSTDPAQVRRIEESVRLESALFIVASKSGSTLESMLFEQYFFERVRRCVGISHVGSRFVAITDPGSALEQLADSKRFRATFHGLQTIGGRYSALSHFGMVPAVTMGINVSRLLDRAEAMAAMCGATTAVANNPAVQLGLLLGMAGLQGRDKVTVVTSPEICGLGCWLGQLLAESTSKNGHGLIPVYGERLGSPSVYGDDRLFVYLRLDRTLDTKQDAAVKQLWTSGCPVIRLGLRDVYDVGAEFFRWEMATAVAGAVLGVNPFDQPDVEASKAATRNMMTEFENLGQLPYEEPVARLEYDGGSLTAYVNAGNAAALGAEVAAGDLEALVATHCARLRRSDYLAVLAYVEMCVPHHEVLQRLRHLVRDTTRVATCLDYGPRFLHSTGQAYKGGPPTGVFLQLTCEDSHDLALPEQSFTFGIVKAAQACGDFQMLDDLKRRALRLHVTGSVRQGLEHVLELVERGLGHA